MEVTRFSFLGDGDYRDYVPLEDATTMAEALLNVMALSAEVAIRKIAGDAIEKVDLADALPSRPQECSAIDPAPLSGVPGGLRKCFHCEDRYTPFGSEPCKGCREHRILDFPAWRPKDWSTPGNFHESCECGAPEHPTIDAGVSPVQWREENPERKPCKSDKFVDPRRSFGMKGCL